MLTCLQFGAMLVWLSMSSQSLSTLRSKLNADCNGVADFARHCKWKTPFAEGISSSRRLTHYSVSVEDFSVLTTIVYVSPFYILDSSKRNTAVVPSTKLSTVSCLHPCCTASTKIILKRLG